jgi:hypothetical protein
MPAGVYTNNTRAVVPWKDLTLANDKYLGDGSLPEGTILCEPSKLQQFAVINMWNYWKKKQRLEQHGLTFIYAREQDRRLPGLKNNKKGKKKATTFIDPSRSPTPENNSDNLFPTGNSGGDPNTAGPSGIPRIPRTPSPPRNPEQSQEENDTEDEELPLDAECPKAHMLTKKGRLRYLKTLCTEETYSAMLRSMQRIKVSKLTLQRLWTPLIWCIGSKQFTA